MAWLGQLRLLLLVTGVSVSLQFGAAPRYAASTRHGALMMSSQKEADYRPPGERRPDSRAMLSVRDADIGIEVRDAGVKGLGVYATERIEACTYLGEYEGEVMSGRDVAVRYRNNGTMEPEDIAWRESRVQRSVGITGDYIWGCGDDVYVDSEDPDVANWCRFLNHAPTSSPACNIAGKSMAKAFGGRPKVWFVSKRVIEPGEELQLDYGDEYQW